MTFNMVDIGTFHFTGLNRPEALAVLPACITQDHAKDQLTSYWPTATHQDFYGGCNCICDVIEKYIFPVWPCFVFLILIISANTNSYDDTNVTDLRPCRFGAHIGPKFSFRAPVNSKLLKHHSKLSLRNQLIHEHQYAESERWSRGGPGPVARHLEGCIEIWFFLSLIQTHYHKSQHRLLCLKLSIILVLAFRCQT